MIWPSFGVVVVFVVLGVIPMLAALALLWGTASWFAATCWTAIMGWLVVQIVRHVVDLNTDAGWAVLAGFLMLIGMSGAGLFADFESRHDKRAARNALRAEIKRMS